MKTYFISMSDILRRAEGLDMDVFFPNVRRLKRQGVVTLIGESIYFYPFREKSLFYIVKDDRVEIRVTDEFVEETKNIRKRFEKRLRLFLAMSRIIEREWTFFGMYQTKRERRTKVRWFPRIHKLEEPDELKWLRIIRSIRRPLLSDLYQPKTWKKFDYKLSSSEIIWMLSDLEEKRLIKPIETRVPVKISKEGKGLLKEFGE